MTSVQSLLHRSLLPLVLALAAGPLPAGEIDLDLDGDKWRTSTVQLENVDLTGDPDLDGATLQVPANNSFNLPLDNDLAPFEGKWHRHDFRLPDEYSNLYFETDLGVNDEFALFINNKLVAIQGSTGGDNFNDPFPGFELHPDGSTVNIGNKLEYLNVSHADFKPGNNIIKVFVTDTGADGSFFRFDADMSFDNPFRPNTGVNDAWFFPSTAGQGFFFIYFPVIDLIFAAWFTFDDERPAEDVMANLGDAGHRWVTFQGPGPGETDTATLNAFLTTGGVFDSGDPPATTIQDPIGTLEVFWHNCEYAHVRYEFPEPDLDDDIPLQRIALDNVALCQALGEEE